MKNNEFLLDQGIWYNGFCNEEEIKRILNPQTPKDYLLQMRANIVADSTRLYRVYLNKAHYFKLWSFEKSFVELHYLSVLDHLSDEDRFRCHDITFGDIFSNDVNGYAEKNMKWGRLIYLNESLQFFMKFCNLALLDFKTDIPPKIRFNALRIAVRTIMNTEALDFFLDPRGIVPKDVGERMLQPIKYELQYIAGHEFSHHLCGHLDDSNLSNRAVLSLEGKTYFAKVYNPLQKQEFEADLQSIIKPQYNKTERDRLLFGALLWFTSLELAEVAQNFICPESGFGYKTHPTAQERYDTLLNNIKFIDKNYNKTIKLIRERFNILKDCLQEDMSVNFEEYEKYGSAYLDVPNTKWRGKELIDRIDY